MPRAGSLPTSRLPGTDPHGAHLGLLPYSRPSVRNQCEPTGRIQTTSGNPAMFTESSVPGMARLLWNGARERRINAFNTPKTTAFAPYCQGDFLPQFRIEAAFVNRTVELHPGFQSRGRIRQCFCQVRNGLDVVLKGGEQFL